MKKSILFSLLGAAMFSMGAAQAGGGSLFGGTGESSMTDNLYLGASAGQATFSCVDSSGALDDCDNTGWKIFGGYKFTDNIAIEGGYYNLAEEEVTFDTPKVITAPTGTASIDKAKGTSSGFGLTGVYSQEVFENFEVFGKLGAMFWKDEVELSGTVTTSEGTFDAKDKASEDGTSA
ncbi:MAG: outer membrane beta-barrel protein, partial [Thiolinea sp.]